MMVARKEGECKRLRLPDAATGWTTFFRGDAPGATEADRAGALRSSWRRGGLPVGNGATAWGFGTVAARRCRD
jgi:hypothetical protein